MMKIKKSEVFFLKYTFNVFVFIKFQCKFIIFETLKNVYLRNTFNYSHNLLNFIKCFFKKHFVRFSKF